jgi:ASC-1-like (ASCH) protein/purine-nucleoside phosphorylase
MDHKMKLCAGPFDKIKSGEKTIEIRCNDEKRRRVRVGDTIIFYKLPGLNECLTAEVTDLYPCKTFEELYAHFDFSEFGAEGLTMEEMMERTREIYSVEKEQKYGALGIRIALIKNNSQEEGAMHVAYEYLLRGIERFDTKSADICRHTFGTDIDAVRERVIIAPWWEPAIFPCFAHAALIGTSASMTAWNIPVEACEITYIKAGIGAPLTMDAILALGVTACKKAVFIGSVGSLDRGIGIGDIVVPAYSVCGDGASRYLYKGLLKDKDVFGETAYPDRGMYDALKNAAETICHKHDVKMHIGRTFSIDTLFAQFAHLDEIMGMGCNVIEMETAAAFRAAEIAGIALGALFSVSDSTVVNKSLMSGRTQEEIEYRKKTRRELFPPIILESLI